jgi:hypothetical protein
MIKLITIEQDALNPSKERISKELFDTFMNMSKALNKNKSAGYLMNILSDRESDFEEVIDGFLFRGKIDGKGEMLIKLGGVIPIVNQSPNEKMNQGAMLRYLAEICWFPTAVLNDYMAWEMIDATSAKATLTINGKAVSGLFSFTEEGELKKTKIRIVEDFV